LNNEKICLSDLFFRRSKERMSAPRTSASALVAAPSAWTAEDRAALQSFLTAELSKVVKNAEYLTKLTTGPALELWMAAFTHKSVNGIAGQNYEGLETVGDKYLGAFFVSYIDKILPRDKRTPSYYTELVRYWLAKERFADFSDKLKFPQFVKVLPEVLNDPDPRCKDTVYEDVFEAFFGALVTVGDTYIRDMVGATYTKQYLFHFLENYLTPAEILLSEDEIFPPKTALKELFDGMRWGDVRYVLAGKPSEPQTTIAVRDFRNDPLAYGRGRDRKDAERDAAINAIKVLAEKGITPASIAANKPVDNEVEGLKASISAFLAKKGKYGPLEFVRVFKETGKNGRRWVEMRTTQDFGTPRARKIALSRGSGIQERQARIAALQEYMNTHGIA
jgi:dsRNA-specific ribonuclease